MGSFYTNATVRHGDVDAVVAALAARGRSAFVSPVGNDCVVVFDEGTEEQDTAEIARFALPLSKRLRCAVLVVLVHDDDMLYYVLFESGRMTDEYNSRPGYFDDDDRPPEGGAARALAAAFDARARAGEVERVLHRNEYGFETERHAALVEALGLPVAAVGTGFRYIEAGELPEGLAAEDLRTVGDARAGEPPEADGTPALSPEEIAVVRAQMEAWVRPSPVLAGICGPEPLQYSIAVSKVINYAMMKRLMKPNQITPDAVLRPVLGDGPITFEQLPLLLKPHLTPVEGPPSGA